MAEQGGATQGMEVHLVQHRQFDIHFQTPLPASCQDHKMSGFSHTDPRVATRKATMQLMAVEEAD